jgi:Holliday junction resolvase RusA-like endonuclease
VTAHYDLNGPWLSIRVHGSPAAQGSKRAVIHRSTGRPVVIEQSKKVKPWRADVRAAAEQACAAAGPDRFPLAGPVAVDITFTLPKPASAPKRRRTWPAVRPDLDKLVRSTLDALKSAGVYGDDGQVVQLGARKAYPGEHVQALTVPGAVIYLYTVRGDQPPPSTTDGQPALNLEGITS